MCLPLKSMCHRISLRQRIAILRLANGTPRELHITHVPSKRYLPWLGITSKTTVLTSEIYSPDLFGRGQFSWKASVLGVSEHSPKALAAFITIFAGLFNLRAALMRVISIIQKKDWRFVSSALLRNRLPSSD